MNLAQAISDTIKYARFFDYELTQSELHHWLISPKIVPKTKISANSPDISINLSKKRLSRLKHSHSKINQAKKVSRLLSYVPTIQLVAITGSLAMDNAKKDDDIDLMIVTNMDTLWLTRLFVVPLLRLFFKSRRPHGLAKNSTDTDSICPNLWLDTKALSVPLSKQNLYTAHEVLQIKPILNKNHTYECFIIANSWSREYLANAYSVTTSTFPTRKARKQTPPFLIKLLNKLAFQLQHAYMHSKITTEAVSLHSAYFHPRSFDQKLQNHLKNTP